MQYSPKLKRIMGQIRKILKDNDVAGVIAIHTPGFSEFAMELQPTYSCAEKNATGDQILIKGKAEHFNGDKKKRDQALQDTINMLHHLSTVYGNQTLFLLDTCKAAEKVWDSEHRGGGFTSHEQQNN